MLKEYLCFNWEEISSIDYGDSRWLWEAICLDDKQGEKFFFLCVSQDLKCYNSGHRGMH